MTLFVIGTIVFVIGSALDIWTSILARSIGAQDYNIFTRDANKQFLWGRNVIFTAILYGICLTVYLAWVHDYQVGAGLIFLGAVRAIVAVANNYPLYTKWRDENSK